MFHTTDVIGSSSTKNNIFKWKSIHIKTEISFTMLRMFDKI